ncbi:MAG: cation-translocating P-type ATPase, partial [Actinomycetes bacterium]
MAARNAIVRRLPAVETLGSVSVIATDKTGTVTEGRMVAQLLWTPAGGEARLGGTGYSPEGSVARNGQPLAAEAAPDVVALLQAAVLCTDAQLRPPDADDRDWHVIGDPTEGALLAAGKKVGVRRAPLAADLPRVGEFPFDSGRKRMTTLHRHPDGFLVVCKGAPELLLHPGTVRDDEATMVTAREAAHAYATAGLRVLAVASTVRPDLPASAAQAEQGLRLLGLVGIADPPKPSASATMAAIRSAGITPVLITGDHPATAGAIARQVGIAGTADQVVDGHQHHESSLDRLTSAAVVARATPEQKVAIIEGRQGIGQIVAMTGDGVNDGPALQRSDIGVAMGQRGTEVARQAADLVLADDELATLVAAVEEGRRVYANVRRFLLYALSGGAAEILVMLVGPFLGMPLPLLPAQILWINLVTHGLPGVALGAEPADPAAMRRPPRPSAESVLGAGLWKRILRIAVLLAGVTLGAAAWADVTGRPWQTVAFLTLGLTQLGVALALRARRGT